MSLRLRLIVVFFLLSVVPLGVVTFYSYTSNVRAVRDAATRESDLLAGELTQRMQLVTAQLSQRIEQLMDLPSAQAASSTPPRVAQDTAASPAGSTTPPPARQATKPAAPKPSPAARPVETPAPTKTQLAPAGADVGDQVAQVAQTLGEAAMLLNNVELRGLGGRGGNPGGGRGWTPPPAPGGEPRSGEPRTWTAVPPPNVTPIPPPLPPGVTPPVAPGVSPSTPPGVTPMPPQAAAAPTAPTSPRGGGANRNPGQRARPGERAGTAGQHAGTGTGSGSGAAGGVGAAGATGGAAAPGAASGGSGAPPNTATVVMDENGHLMIDLAPVRREILKQIVPEGHLETLTPEERQRIARDVNQRLLGIKQGLELGAAGLQKRAADAERQAADAEAKAQGTTAASAKSAAGAAGKSTAGSAKTADATAKSRDTAAAAPTPSPAAATGASPTTGAAPMKKKTELTGSHLGVMVEQNGQVVEQIGAEINMPQVLASVFATTRRDRGEVPFAIGKDGKLYAPTDADRKTIEDLHLAIPTDNQSTSTITKGDWIVVTTADPSGSGLHFGIAKPVADLLSEIRKTAARNASFGLGFIALALIGIVPLSNRLTRNLSKLTEGVDRISQGDYSARVPLKTGDEIGRLATAFNRMATDVEQHQRAAVEQERVKRELELGRQIQHEMLPHAPLRLGLTEIKGVSVPALEVGGDFFNYFELSDHRVALLVGDVSGKGVGAALLMANIQASLRTRLALGQDLSAIADAIDRDVDANSPGTVYATLFVGILDPATRRLQYVNAGHHPQYALCRDGLERMPSTGLPVGLLSGHGYTANEVQLSAGDLLFFYTDGCVEASNPAGDMFGPERLEAVLTSGGPSNPDDILQRVEQAVKTFRGAAEPFDDETMMAVKVG